MAVVYLALGSNLADPTQQVASALAALKAIPKTELLQCSRFYRTKPLGPQDQPDYLNAVVKLKTELEPEQLLDETQSIELNQGRVREGQRWGPRTLDIDILFYDDMTISTPRLTVPHYDVKNREFMLYPLADIAPYFVFPDGTQLNELLTSVDKNGLSDWAE
jgi:2-amino-4-hydroxy-6-hydroxymethyldihydropteridine diphosphokinase